MRRGICRILHSIACLLLILGAACAQEALRVTGSPLIAAAMPSPMPASAQAPTPIRTDPGYGGDFATRSTLTGDWGGLRDSLARHGYLFNIGITQIEQGNAGGGENVPNIYRYETSQYLECLIDTQRAGWWKNGRFRFLIQAREGLSVNATQGSIYAVNMDALYPVPFPLNANIWAFSVYSYTQIISPQFALTAGKIQSRPANEFAGDEKTQFFSNKMNLLPPYGSIIPTADFWGLILLYRATRDANYAFIIADPNSTANTFKLADAFSGPKSYAIALTQKVRTNGHPGHQRLVYAYTNRRHALIFNVPGIDIADLPYLPPILAQIRTSDWIVGWDMDQYLSNVDGDPHRGVGIFAKATLSSGVVNAVRYFVNAGVGGKGFSRVRPDDSFGVGFYYSVPSPNIAEVIKPFVQDEYGYEAYYNYALTPWFHLSPDVQWIVQPTRKSAGQPLVIGLRAQLTL